MRKLSPILAGLLALAAAACQSTKPLPHPESFEPTRYLGKWYEIGRLPVFYQPDNTLAQAEYGPSDNPGQVTVFNQSFDQAGRPLKSIRGTATLAEGPPPGRFTVRFPGIPSFVAAFSGPNYYVIHVDDDYRTAVVGVPSRGALWILSRDPNLPESKRAALIAIAREAGFDTDRLILAKWP